MEWKYILLISFSPNIFQFETPTKFHKSAKKKTQRTLNTVMTLSKHFTQGHQSHHRPLSPHSRTHSHSSLLPSRIQPCLKHTFF